MKTTAHIAVAFAPAILAAVYPIIRAIRTERYFTSFLLCWALLVFWLLIFSLAAPLLVCQINGPLGQEIFAEWAPDPRGVIGAIFFGWPFALVMMSFAILLRSLHQRFKPGNRS
jgi:hypothetical protein